MDQYEDYSIMTRSCLTLIALAMVGGVALVLSPSGEAKVKVWHHCHTADYKEAELAQTVVSSEGVVQLSRELKTLTSIRAAHVWDLVEDRKGNLYVATGGEGKVFKVTPAGKVVLVYTSPDSQILCLVAAADGAIYAGTGPNGLVVQIEPKGPNRVVAEGLGHYVWSLVIDEQTGSLYAGTGPKGRIYEIPRRGKPTVFYATRQDHILCLARDAQGILYAGTDRGGLVYRIDSHSKGFVLFSTQQSEVRSLLVTTDGVYAGTSHPGGKGGGNSRVTSGSEGSFSPVNPGAIIRTGAKKNNAPGKIIKTVSSSKSSPTDDDDGAPSNKAAPSAPAPEAGENSLYRIAPDGTVRELFRERALILTLARQQGTLLLGTGMRGQLFALDEQTKERTEIARLDHGQVHCLLHRRDGSVVLGTGDPGKLYVLQNHYAGKGTVLSDVMDAKILSKWGTTTWRADTPAGTRISIAFRSGNVHTPDETWSDWSGEQTDPEQARINCPPARFLQYRLTLQTDNPRRTPSLRTVSLRYKTTNHAPEVTKIEVPDLDGEELENPKKVMIRWKAQDPNEDELTYSIYVHKQGWQHWVCLDDNFSKREFNWDITAMPTGMYQVKVVASDHKDNPDGEALKGERTSPAFPVTHLPPVVSVRVVSVENGKALLEANAVDPMVRLTGASYSVNGKRWVNVFPKDGLFDSKTETFQFRTEALRDGNYVVVLRARNAAGMVGAADAVFTIPKATPK
jgi:hypothetical protein